MQRHAGIVDPQRAGEAAARPIAALGLGAEAHPGRRQQRPAVRRLRAQRGELVRRRPADRRGQVERRPRRILGVAAQEIAPDP